jgi:hypothetical protein
MIQRLVLLAALLFAWPNPARADLNPESKTPYKLQVVLHFAPHRNMTDVFREQVKQFLGDSLQAALGELARVEVVETHPLLKDVLDNGLQHALDRYRVLDNTKVHFVLIDYVQGQYEITSRQYDGTVGLPSPTVRQDQTDDRRFVARQAGLLVIQDFGLVGTIEGDRASPQKVTVAIKGGGLNVPLDPWIQKHDVFALAEIVGQSGAVQRSSRRQWTLLQVLEAPKDGACVCRVLSRYEWPPPSAPGSQGLRCLKLATTQGPLKLRLIDDKQSHNGLRLSVSGLGFDQGADKEALVTGPDGTVQSSKTYKNLACVLIDDGSGEKRRLPIEIVDDRTVVCTIKLQQGGEQLGQLGMRRAAFFRRLDQDRMFVDGLWQDLQKEGALKPTDWLKQANDGFAVLQSELLALTKERDQLKKEQADLAKDPRFARSNLFDLAAAEQILSTLQGRQEELGKKIDVMKQMLASGEFEKRDKSKIEIDRAKALLDQAEFDQAIAICDKVLAETNDPSVKKLRDDLVKLWEPQGQQHKQSREILLVEWAKCTTAKQMKDKLEEVKTAFAVCKSVNDFLGARKLSMINQDHAAQLRAEVETLKPENEDDRTTLELFKVLPQELDAFVKSVTDFLASAKPKNAGQQ